MQPEANEKEVVERLNKIVESARQMDPDLHSALAISLIAGFKGIVGWDADTANKAAEVMEAILSDFDGQPAN